MIVAPTMFRARSNDPMTHECLDQPAREIQRPPSTVWGLWLALLGALLFASGPSIAHAAPTKDECLACHGDPDMTRSAPKPGRSNSLYVNEAARQKSVHARLECVQCHRVATAPHDEPPPPVRCASCHAKEEAVLRDGVHGSSRAQAHVPAPTCVNCHGTHDVARPDSKGIERCEKCHSKEVADYRTSIHGRSRMSGDTEAATCGSCHGKTHAILSKSDERSRTYPLNLPRTCAQCHSDPELAKRHNIPVGNVYQLYMDSIHGRAITQSGLLVAATCSSCHGSHAILPPSDPMSRVYRGNIPQTCGSCHAGVLATYRESIHGKKFAEGDTRAPICIDCHTTHEIRRVADEAWKVGIVKQCGTCHVESLAAYRDTFHGQVSALGFTRVARCSDCHGSHNILPKEDPRSSVNPANRVDTCRKCHATANANFARYDPHPDPHNRDRNPTLYYAAKFMTWLLIGVFGFFGVHNGLWAVRMMIGRSGHTPPPSKVPGPDDSEGSDETRREEEGDRG